MNRFFVVVLGVAWVAGASVLEAAPVLISDSRFAEVIRQMSPPNGSGGTASETWTDGQPHSQFKLVSENTFGFNSSSRVDVTSAYLPPAGGGGVSVGGPSGGFAISSGEIFSIGTATSVGNTSLSRATWEVNAIFTTDTPMAYTFSGDRHGTLTGIGSAIDYRAELRNDSTGGSLVFQELGGDTFAYSSTFTGTVAPGTYHLRIHGATQSFFASGDTLGTGSGDIALVGVQLGLVSVPEPGAVGLLAAAATTAFIRRRRR